LGDLLNAPASNSNPPAKALERAAEPRLSAGMQTLVRHAEPPRPPNESAELPRHVRVSLLGADALLTGGAALYVARHGASEPGSLIVALLVIALGGWLGWLGLTAGKSWR
jgi:hypothetical protein